MQLAGGYRFDGDAVRQLVRLAADARDLVDQCLQAVRLMPASTRDYLTARGVSGQRIAIDGEL